MKIIIIKSFCIVEEKFKGIIEIVALEQKLFLYLGISKVFRLNFYANVQASD